LKYYYEAIRYATKLNLYPPFEARDLTHDAYVAWHNKTGNNLFDEHPRTIFSVLRNVFRDKLKRSTWSFNKEQQGSRQYVEFKDHVTSRVTPYDIMVGQQLLDRMKQTVKPSVLDLKLEGYTNKEIAHKLNVTKAAVTWHTNKLQKLVSTI